MRLEEVTLRNFKNYSGEHRIPLNKAITIFYGQNGFGKSTFFDGLEWALTGGISRFRNEYERDDLVNHDALSQNGECAVELSFGEYQLKRWMRLRNGKAGNIYVRVFTKSGEPVARNQEDVEQFFSNIFHVVGGVQKGKTLRKSHILSQDEVSDFISKFSPKTRFEQIVDIMGMGDVINALVNIDQIIKFLRDRIKTESDRLEGVDQKVKEVRGERKPINIKLAESALTLMGHHTRLEDITEEQRRQIRHNIVSLESVLSVINELSDLGYKSVNDVRNSVQNLHQTVDQHFSRHNQHVLLRERLQQLIQSLNKEIKSSAKLNNLDQQIFTASHKLKDIELPDISLDEIGSKIDRLNKDLEIVDYAISNQSEHRKITERIASTPHEIETVNKELAFLLKRENRIAYARITVSERIQENERLTVSKLLQDLQGIQEYLTSHTNVGICPVCSTEHGSNLITRLEQNLRRHHQYEDKVSRKASRLLTLQHTFSRRSNEVTRNRQKSTLRLKELEDELKHAKLHINQICGKDLFSSKMFETPSDELYQKRHQLQQDIHGYDQFRQLTFELQKLKMQRASIVGNTEHQNSAQMTSRLPRLKRALGRIEARKGLYSSQREEYIKQINALEKHIGILDQVTYETDFVAYKKTIERHLKEYVQHDRILSLLLNRKDRISHNERIQSRVRKLQIESDDIGERIARLNERSTRLEQYRLNVRSKLGEQTMSFLNKPNSRVQTYYRYLNPLPSASPIYFEDSNNKELTISVAPVSDALRRSNAKVVLSSGQMNVLAISIFLAVNCAPNVSLLDFVAIDDPIQNMDDVNKFSLCDVLSTTGKQLIFSTHDYDFLRLFLKKNETQLADIQVIMLESPNLKEGMVRPLKFH